MSYREHRRALRLEVSGDVTTRLVGVDTPVELRDVGPGGFLLWTRTSIPASSMHAVQFTTRDGWTTTLKARAVHARRLPPLSAPAKYAIGFAFELDGAAEHEAIERLIDKITAVLSFD